MATPAQRVHLFRPFERFFRLEAAGGIVLLSATLIALTWANSPFFSAYTSLWGTRAVAGLGGIVIDKPLLLWVNDGLMAVFFLLVGLEIKRELLTGELSNRRSAALPIVAAIGGMIVPALLYLAVTRGTPVSAAWGIPMATDIAFALGGLAILGRRLPPSLRVFLAAAAIVDDIGAVLVIAFVYTPKVSLVALAVAGAAFLTLVALNRASVRHLAPYVIIGIVLWVAFLKSGVHATIAGVLLAFVIPARGRPATDHGAQASHALPTPAMHAQTPMDRAAALLAAEKAIEAQEAPLTRMEHALLPWVTFGIIPVFALANAGVRLEGSLVDALVAPVSMGIILGLVVGKQIGMLAFPWLAVRLGWASMPVGASWHHMWGVSLLAGIGFTMSLFVASLALGDADLVRAKLAVLTASVIAAVGGILVLARSRIVLPTSRTSETR